MSKKAFRLSPFVDGVVLPLIVGLAAGISGGLIAYSAVSVSLMDVPTLPHDVRPRTVSTTPLPEADLAKRLDGLSLPVFRKSDLDAGTAAMTDAGAVGQAAVVTSDGWLLTHESVLTTPVVVGHEGGFKTPTRRVEDPRTGLVFLKIENGSLQVSGFEETEHLGPGTALYARGAAQGFAKAYFAGTGTDDALRDSDVFSLTYHLDRDLADTSVGGAVVTSSGNLAGVLTPDGFVPAHLFRPVLSDAFRGQALDRASLGLRYMDLARVYRDDEKEASVGARITGSTRRGLAAVRFNSAAAEAGLKEGDVILRMENTELTGQRDLAEVVGEFDAGKTAEFEILRDGERRFIDVVFR